SGCRIGSPLPGLDAFPLVTWSLAESQAAHRQLLSRLERSDGPSDQSSTRLMAVRVSRLEGGQTLMTGCEVAEGDASLSLRVGALTPNEERLQALDSFAGGLAKEFGDLLGVIHGCAHLLKARFPRAADDADLRSVV